MRTIVYVIVGIFVLTFMRMVVGIVMRGFSDLMKAEGPAAQPPPRAGGQLVRDPVCGAFVSKESATAKVVRGETVCFCSEKCRDKYTG